MVAIGPDDGYEPKYKTWQDLDDAVRAHGRVLRVLMWDLRFLSGFQRLKVNVVATISEQLRNIGLDHLPEDLPRDRNQHVVVFKIGSEAGAVINAVRNGTSSEEAERALRKLNTSDSIRADRQNEAKIAELTEKADELETLLKGFRDILNA
jgi:DNA-directed RNA polymerase subunit H (RpoH/RPB5)